MSALVYPSNTIHLPQCGPAIAPHPPAWRCWLFAGAQIRQLSATGSAESGWWSLWRSGLAHFNTASTSNNSRLWQLCIIHLVESFSLSFLLDAVLSLSSFSLSSAFFYFFLFCLSVLGEERENQGSVPSDAACFPLTPVIVETEECLSVGWFPGSVNPGCHLNHIVFLLYRGSMPASHAARQISKLPPQI